MKRLLFFFTILLCAFVLSLSAKETIKIGTILPLSGRSLAQSGEDLRDALKLAMDEQKSIPTKYEYQIIYEDSQNSPRMAAEAFKKLSDIDHVKMVLTAFGGPSSTVTPLANNKKIIHMGLAFSTSVAKPPYSFNNFSKPGPNAELMAKFCQAAGYKKVAFISQQHSSTNALEESFKKISAAYGIEIVGLQKFAPPEKDFRVALLKLRETNPDLLFVHAFDPEASIIVRQMKEISWDVPITAMAHWGSFSSPLFLNIPYVEIAQSKEYMNRFYARYKRHAVYFTGYIIDSLNLYIQSCEAYEGKGVPSSDFIAQKIQATHDYPGIMGKMTPDENGWFDSPAAIIVKTSDGRRDISLEEAVKLAKTRAKTAK